MSKRDEAFELFNEGKVVTDLEVVALGVKDETAKRYYRNWTKLQSAPAAVESPASVAVAKPVSAVPDGAIFEHRGLFYQKRGATRNKQVLATRMVKASYANTFTPKGSAEFAPNVLVKAK